MRLVATLSFLFIFSAPVLIDEPLRTDEVARFIAAAEEIMASHVPIAGESVAQAISSPDLEEAAAILDRHGFSERRWRTVAQRVLAAHEASRLTDLPGNPAQAERRLTAIPSPSERWAMLTIVRMQRDEMVALEATTAKDRDVIAPYLDRLNRLGRP